MKQKINNKGSKHHKARGAILLMVLGLLMLLSFLLTGFLKTLMDDLRFRSQVYGSSELRHHAYNGLEIALAVLNEIQQLDHGLYSPLQGWGNPLAYAKVTFPKEIQVMVSVVDETGKLPLRNPERRSLEILFGKIGFDFLEAQEASKNFIKWCKRKAVPVTLFEAEKNNSKTEQKVNAKKDLKKKSEEKKLAKTEIDKLPSELQTYGQLYEIESLKKAFFDGDGNANQRFMRFTLNTSLFTSGPININTAPEDVLSVLSKLHSLDLDAVKQFLGKTKDENTKPHFYRSLEEINRRKHGRLILDKPKEETEGSKEDDKTKEKFEKGKQAEQNAIPTKSKSPSINKQLDVLARVLKVSIFTKKAELSFGLTAIIQVNAIPEAKENSKGKAKKQSSAEKAKENVASKSHLTHSRKNTYNAKAKALGNFQLRVVSLTEGCLEDL